jgi:RNA polymerase sigma-70 factor (ECF subfamily)
MAEILAGRKSAMKMLVERYKKKAYFLALGMVGNSDEALDISQEAFIKVFKSARRFDQDQRFFPWFYSIVINLCKDCLHRRETHESKEIDVDDNTFLLVDDRNPEKSLIKQEEADAVRKAVMQLDPDDREIIMLKHFRDVSYEEIAALLKIPKGTVMSRLYYARKKLAKLLNEFS